MDNITLIIEISVAVLIAAVVISVMYLQFKNSINEFKQTSSEVIDTTSKFDMVLLKQYDNTTMNGYDVRYAIKQYGTFETSKNYIPSKAPQDFFVCIKFKEVPSGDIKRSTNGVYEVEFIIPNRYEQLNNFTLNTINFKQYLGAYYIAPEAEFSAYLLIQGIDNEVEALQRMNVARSIGYDVESDEVLGIYFEEK